MKTIYPGIIATVLFLWLVPPIQTYSQSSTHNYIETTDVLDSQVLLPDQLNQLSGQQVRNTINYYDGLGKPVQSIVKGKSPGHHDMVTYTEYDDFGRVVDNYLPFTKEDNNGAYVTDARTELMGYYANPAYPGIPQTYIPYGFQRYDDSPLNRVVETSLPGDGYERESGHTRQIDYSTNTSGEVFLFKDDGFGNITRDGYYLTGKLSKVTTTDENGVPSIVFNNLKGQPVLKRIISGSEHFDTYYVYNDYGLLSCVIMPEANTTTGTFGDYDNAFKYDYDERKRMIGKHIPGKGEVYYVYDRLDRLVAEQDEVMRNFAEPTWKFYKYDALNRVVYEGRFLSPMSRGEMQGRYDGLDKTNLHEEPRQGGIHYGYTNNIFPAEGIIVHQATFYDDYDFDNDGISDHGQYYKQGISDTAMLRVQGQVTGRKHKSDEVPYLTTEVYFYDSYYRPVQQNRFLDTTHREVFYVGNHYSFGGAVLRTNYSFTSLGGPTLDYSFSYQYDHDWRVKGYSLLLGNDSINLLMNDYSETGTLITKHYDILPGDTLYSMDYQYNPRGWLTGINELTTDLNQEIFGMELYYENPPQEAMVETKAQYNGNISAMKWHSPFTQVGNTINTYAFLYDSLSRITRASYYEINQGGTINVSLLDTTNLGLNSGFATGLGSVGNITYDKNGNIESLARAFTKDGQSVTFDKLTYYYSANQLIAVDDAQTGQNAMGDFTDNGHKYTIWNLPEFRYDLNGNMTEDINRDIRVDYIQGLNLPRRITFPEGYIVNGYFYDGTKYSKTRFDQNSNLLEEEKYFGNLIIRNNRPLRILHDEGYIDLTDLGQIDQRNYHIKDHLGNVRVVIQDYNNSHLITQVSTYYPFGMVMQPERFVNSQEETDNDYLYNGKEQQEMPGGWYDYGWRYYDPQISRWHVSDPKSEKYFNLSNFNYCANNPIKYIDPEGDTITLSNSLLNNEVALEAHNHWKSTEAGQEFYSMFDIGGEFEGVSVYFGIDEDVVTNNGTMSDASGDTKVFGVNKESGEKTKLYPQSFINERINSGVDMTGKRSSLLSNEYLRYEVNTLPGQWIKESYSNELFGRKLWNANIGRVKRKAKTINHEANHIRLFQNDITNENKLWYDADGHHYFMKNPQLYPNKGTFLSRKGYHETE
jgi:RHS repeat-associated protein